MLEVAENHCLLPRQHLPDHPLRCWRWPFCFVFSVPDTLRATHLLSSLELSAGHESRGVTWATRRRFDLLISHEKLNIRILFGSNFSTAQVVMQFCETTNIQHTSDTDMDLALCPNCRQQFNHSVLQYLMIFALQLT